MRGNMTSRIALIPVAAVIGMLLTIAPPAALAETELVLSSWLPPRHPIVVNAVRPWARQIEEVTSGRVRVRVLARPLGPTPAHFDMAVDGVADVTYGLHSFTGDNRFTRSRIGQFSFVGDDATRGSKAFWNVYTEMLDAEAEHKGVKLLGLFVHGPGVLHNNVRRLERPTDLKGLKIRTPGGYIADLMAELGATTVFMSSGEVYEKLSRGVIDGVSFTYEALTAFRLTRHLKFAMRVPGGIYNTTWFLVVNEAKWSEISPTDQTAIEAISGESFAELVGQAWTDADTAAIEEITADGIELYDASPLMLNAIRTRAQDFEAEWTEVVARQGFDGAKALEALRRQSGVTQ